jgi:uncharacterized protein
VRLDVRVSPGARQDALRGFLADGSLKLAVTAPAEGGRANAAVLALLAGALGVAARDLTVVRGASARRKQIEIAGLAPDDVRRRLQAACGAA